MKRAKLSAIVFAAIMAFFLIICGTTGAVAAGVDITGHWWGSNGVEYDITQIGTAFDWKVTSTGEIGVGTINGKDCSAGWPFGFATGKIITNPSGATVEIVWSNGVVFRRAMSGPGGTPMPPSPSPSPSPGTSGGGTNDLEYTFGPNPAWPGAEVWLNLNQPVAHDIKIWHNGAALSITKYTSNYNVVVELPMNVTSGPLRVEYKGKRIESNQPKKDLEIKPIDASGKWFNKEDKACSYVQCSIKQNGTKFTLTIYSSVQNTTSDGEIIDGKRLRYYTDKTKTKYSEWIIDTVDSSGRATKLTMPGVKCGVMTR
jgi:hypothetical protein